MGRSQRKVRRTVPPEPRSVAAEVDVERARAVTASGARTAQNDTGAALVDIEVVCQIGPAAAADFLGDLQPGEPLIRLQILGPALAGQGQPVQLSVVVSAAPLVLSRIVAVVGHAVNQLPVALKPPLIAVQRVLAAVEYKAVLAVTVAHRAAAGGEHAVGRSGGLHNAPDLVVGGGRHRVAGEAGLDVGRVALNRLDGRHDAAAGDALVLVAGADGDDVANLQHALGDGDSGLIGARAGHGNVRRVQTCAAVDLDLHIPRAVDNDHQVGQHLKVGAGIDAVCLAPQPCRSQKLRDRLAAGADNARDAVQLAVRTDAAGERGQVALLFEGAVTVAELPRRAESGHRHSRHARINVQHTGHIEQRHLHKHLTVGAVLRVAGLPLVGVDRDRSVCVQRAATAPHARPGVHPVKVILPGARIGARRKHKLRSRPRPRPRRRAAGELHAVECSAHGGRGSLGRRRSSIRALARLGGAGLGGGLGRLCLSQIAASIRQQCAKFLPRAGVAVRLCISVGGHSTEVGGKNGTISHGSVPPNSCHRQ